VLPSDVALHDVTVGIVAQPGEGLLRPRGVRRGELVTTGERTVLDEESAHVVTSPGGGQFIEALVTDAWRFRQRYQES
jgi:hypothetical protein